MPSLNIPLAFLAGLLSMLSPCVFSLIPMYLGYLSGITLGHTEKTSWRVFSHALAFVFGFTVVFVLVLGLPTTLLSRWLTTYSVWLMRLGSAILILFGLHTLHVINIPWFDLTYRADVGRDMAPGYLRSVLFGVAFASGWSPCVGPLLGLVMTLSFSEPGRAMIFLLAYAMGLAVPFLAAALLLSRVMEWLQRLAKHTRTIEWISGSLMIIIGLLMVTNLFSVINNWLIQLPPVWLSEHL